MRPIDADELLNQYPEDEQGEFSFIPVYEVRNNIKRAPTIDPIKHGHWIEDRIGDTHCLCYDCSECGNMETVKNDYCPWCGARMDDEVMPE